MYTQSSFEKIQQWEAELERMKHQPRGESCLSATEEAEMSGGLSDEEFIEYWAKNSVEPGVIEAAEGDSR